MLQDDSLPALPRGSAGISELTHFAPGFLRRQYLVIICAAGLALTATVIYLRVTPPTYTAQVRVLFGNPKAPFIQQQSMLAETPLNGVKLESQLQILWRYAKANTSGILIRGILDQYGVGLFKLSRFG